MDRIIDVLHEDDKYYYIENDNIYIENKIIIDQHLNVKACCGYLLNYEYKIRGIKTKTNSEILKNINFYLDNVMTEQEFEEKALQKREEELAKDRLIKNSIKLKDDEWHKIQSREREYNHLIEKFHSESYIEDKLEILRELFDKQYNIDKILIDLVENLPENTFAPLLFDICDLLDKAGLNDYTNLILESIINGNYDKNIINKAKSKL